jgi:DNA topoisomerase VI subunit B
MAVNDLKKELVSYIENTNDEELLHLLKEDFKFYSKTTDTDITDALTEEQLNELKALAEEDETKNTHTLDEFKKATDKWRIR